MKEKAFNLFLYVEKMRIVELGAVVHELDGPDADKISFLQNRMEEDYKSATRFKVKPSLQWSEYEARIRLGRQLEVFEEVFRHYHASSQPILAITPIVDGVPKILTVTGVGALNLEELQNAPLSSPGTMVDYLKMYVQGSHFDLPRLVNDDYFKAIKLLYNAGCYVSAAKLLMSFIDTAAFVDAGDVPRNFVQWLEQYATLTPLGITADELWEFRNGLLHMTNLNSRSVAKGTTARLIMYVGTLPTFVAENHGEKYFNLKQLLDTIAEAIGMWSAAYNSSPDKFVDFVARYDLTVSDSRLAVVPIRE